MTPSKTLTYLASEYPGISHTFIFREITVIRQMGMDVITASIRRPALLDRMTPAEKTDAENTLYIKSALGRLLGSHLKLFAASPAGYLKMMGHALGLARKGPRSLFKGLAYLAEAGILLQWMQGQGSDHVHVHFANPAATVAMIASTYGTISFSLSVHGPDIFYTVDTGLLAEKVIRARAVRCISHYCRSQLMRLMPHDLWGKLDIVRCGIDPDRFSPRPDPANAAPGIICVGRLVPAKGQHILLEACHRLKKRDIDFTLTLVGDGPDRSSLESLCRSLDLTDRVTFTGAVGQDEVPDLYRKADIFAIASFAEGVPVVLMEAMAMEIPSVSTRITGIPELIDHGRTGMLCTPADALDLADTLEQLIRDPELRNTLGRQGRRRVIDTYNLDTNCRQMAEFFNDVSLPDAGSKRLSDGIGEN